MSLKKVASDNILSILKSARHFTLNLKSQCVIHVSCEIPKIP